MTMPKHPLFSHGSVWPFSIPVSLSWIEIGAILSIIHEFQIKTFVEIGVENGGLASLLIAREEYLDSFSYWGMELHPEKISTQVRARATSGSLFMGDFFSQDAFDWLSILLLRQQSPLLFFCDNGNKPLEVHGIFEMQLHPSDLVLVHDFRKEFKLKDVPAGVTILPLPCLKGTRLLLMKKS